MCGFGWVLGAMAGLLGGGGVCTGESLIPTGGNLWPDYFCTWNVQGYVCSYASGEAQRRAMVEGNVFGTGKFQGWAELYPSIRRHLFFVMDDSWDVPLNGDRKYFGSLVLNGERFPSFDGGPGERLGKLRDAVVGRGWRGLGGWVCAQQAAVFAVADDEAYWKQRLGWMREGGVEYWKVDWGERERDATWRTRLTALAAAEAPKLVVEHALTEGAIRSAAVYRTYDVENVISAPVTIGRVAHLLKVTPKGSRTVINCEDEPYVAAGMGAAIGVMRHPFVGALPDGRQDFVFPPVGRDLKRRVDEVVRGVNWHRIADALPASGEGDTVDTVELVDWWMLEKDETYTDHRKGDRREGRAPGRVARGGLKLPEVEMREGGLAPFVLVSRSPNGAVAVAAIGRTLGREYRTPGARVKQDVGSARRIGVFGVFESLTLRFEGAVGPCRVLAQDLAGGEAEDITGQVRIEGEVLMLDGKLISRVGLSAGAKGDLSEPGMVVEIRK